MHFTGIDKEEGCDIRPPSERVEDVPVNVPESCGATSRKGIDLPSVGETAGGRRGMTGIGLVALFKEKKAKTSRNLRAVGNEGINRVRKAPEANLILSARASLSSLRV